MRKFRLALLLAIAAAFFSFGGVGAAQAVAPVCTVWPQVPTYGTYYPNYWTAHDYFNCQYNTGNDFQIEDCLSIAPGFSEVCTNSTQYTGVVGPSFVDSHINYPYWWGCFASGFATIQSRAWVRSRKWTPAGGGIWSDWAMTAFGPGSYGECRV